MVTPYYVEKDVAKSNPRTHKMEHSTKKEWTSNAERMSDFIKKFGESKFNEISKVDEKFAELHYLDFPIGSDWIVNHFFQIWKHCEYDINGNKIFTPKQILDYCECFGVYMTYREKQLIMKMKEWAIEAIAELKKEKEK